MPDAAAARKRHIANERRIRDCCFRESQACRFQLVDARFLSMLCIFENEFPKVEMNLAAASAIAARRWEQGFVLSLPDSGFCNFDGRRRNSYSQNGTAHHGTNRCLSRPTSARVLCICSFQRQRAAKNGLSLLSIDRYFGSIRETFALNALQEVDRCPHNDRQAESGVLKKI